MQVRNCFKLLAVAVAFSALVLVGCKTNPSTSDEDTREFIVDARDNQRYRIVTIGTQTWMAENLNYNASGSKCYDDNSSNCNTYGRLYDWETAVGVCPAEWHLPDTVEWTTLTNYVGAERTGTKLKSASGWMSGNGTDDYGFSGLPGGMGDSDGGFDGVGYYGYWWSTTERMANDAYHRGLGHNSVGVYTNSKDKTLLYSVRCVKN